MTCSKDQELTAGSGHCLTTLSLAEAHCLTHSSLNLWRNPEERSSRSISETNLVTGRTKDLEKRALFSMEMEPVRNCQTRSMRETEVGSWANRCWTQGKAGNWNNINGKEEEWWTMLGNAYPSWIQVRQLPSGWKHPSLMRPPGGVSKDPGHCCPPHLDEYNWQSPLPPNNWYYPFPKWLPHIIFFFFLINSQTKGLLLFFSVFKKYLFIYLFLTFDFTLKYSWWTMLW